MMERLRKSRLALVVLRILLVSVLFVDAGFIAMIFQHWHSGGVEGVKAWIVHVHATFLPNRWEVPIEQLVRDSYREFSGLVAVLAAATAILCFGERRMSRLPKVPGGSPRAMTH